MRRGRVAEGVVLTVQRRNGCIVLLGGSGSSRGWCWMAEGEGEAAGDDATAGEVVDDEAAARCRASRSSLSCNSSKLGELSLAAAVGAMLLGLGEGGALYRWTRFTARQNSGCPSTSCTHPLRVLRTTYFRPFRVISVVALNPEASKFSSSSWLSFSPYGS